MASVVNGQMERLISAAQEKVSFNAQEASDREILLACFGWLAGKLCHRQHSSMTIPLTAGGVGAVIGGIIAATGKVMGWF